MQPQLANHVSPAVEVLLESLGHPLRSAAGRLHAELPERSCISGRCNTAVISRRIKIPPFRSLPVPDRVVEVIRDGISPPTGAFGRSMPAVGSHLSEAEITASAEFLRTRFSTPGWTM
jgi:hypothetical protein